ncbi:MAG TPA: exo-alpha-sialidase [Paracoccaceae bacterium]|nr:exo-alpha-sialidase [Paracoccaceae bacterium]
MLNSLPDSPEEIAIRMDGVMRDAGNGRSIAFLPSPRVQNHAAFLLPTANGGLRCAWFGGALEGKADICIHQSTLDPATGIWGPAEQLTSDPDRSEQNPVLFNSPDGRHLLFHTAQPGGDQDRCVVRMREIGAPPQDLPLPLGTFVRATPIVRNDGSWLLPLFHCTQSPGARWTGRHDTASVAITNDNGLTWRLVKVPDSVGCVHMTLVPLDKDKIVAFFRRRQADYVYRSESLDGGESWSVPEATDLPNNNSSIAAQRLADGRIAVVCNPVNAEMDPSRRESLYDELGDDDRPEADGGCTAIWGVKRAPLIVAFSDDDGKTFPDRITVADSAGTCLSNNSEDGKNKELSYPAISQAKNGDLDVAFTYYRRAIVHIRIPASEIRKTI